MFESEMEERGKLIEQMLDKIRLIPSGAPQEVQDSIDSERQLIAVRAGWGSMPIEQLRQVAAGRQQ